MRAIYTPSTAACSVEAVLRQLEGRWKLVILFHLFGGQVQRFSELEKLIPEISQKMLAQQLRQLEADGIVHRTAYAQVPPKVEYRMTEGGPGAVSGIGCTIAMGGTQGDAQSRCLSPRGFAASHERLLLVESRLWPRAQISQK